MHAHRNGLARIHGRERRVVVENLGVVPHADRAHEDSAYGGVGEIECVCGHRHVVQEDGLRGRDGQLDKARSDIAARQRRDDDAELNVAGQQTGQGGPGGASAPVDIHLALHKAQRRRACARLRTCGRRIWYADAHSRTTVEA